MAQMLYGGITGRSEGHAVSGHCYVRLPFLGEAVIVFCVAEDRFRPWCAFHRAAQAGWRTVWLGKLQISHNFR